MARVLRSQPTLSTISRILQTLAEDAPAFTLHAPGPAQAQIVSALITSVLPTCSHALDPSDLRRLARCLRNVAGIAAVVARVRLLSDRLAASQPSTAHAEELGALLALAGHVLPVHCDLGAVWAGLHASTASDAQRQLAWTELVAVLGSGKVVAAAARAEDLLKDAAHARPRLPWLSRGSDYAAWLGRGIVTLLGRPASHPAAAQLLAKAFGLGYRQALVAALVVDVQPAHLPAMLAHLPAHAVRQLMETTLQCLSAVSSAAARDPDVSPQGVSAIAGLVCWLIDTSRVMQQSLLSHLSDAAVNSTLSAAVRAASIAALVKTAADQIHPLLHSSLTTFANQLFINHAAAIQQESVAQTILMAGRALYRQSPVAVARISRSSGHMQGVSGRLHSSNSRARWLGMTVGMALSSLVDEEGSQMDFGTDDMQTDEARWYLGLVTVDYEVGSLDDFQQLRNRHNGAVAARARNKPRGGREKLPMIDGKQSFGPPLPPVQTEVVGDKVTELGADDEDEDEDDHLKPYAKPDDDPEDSDEDATLVNRDKPRPPVYIRDLMRMLRNTEKPDAFQMGIKHASTLIRRKLDFGNEVRDHAEELGLLFCDLQDPFDTDDFDELRLQALIAVLLSDVANMAPWLSRQAFVGEYSLSQRSIMLSALGLAGRELAGLQDQDVELNPALPPSISFPSKRLTGRLHAVYDPTSAPVKRLEAASHAVEHQLIKPLALHAADQATSALNAVKVRTFSSRLSAENRTKRKPAPNRLAKTFAASFFFPLASQYQRHLAAYGPSSVYASSPLLLVTFLKTLALLLHASGPATLQLPEAATAFWDLLLSLRVRAASDVSILEAVLFSTLTLLEVRTEHGGAPRVVQEAPQQLVETQQWVELVFERLGGGDLVVDGSAQESRNRTLAAAVLVTCREILEAYRAQLIPPR